VEVMGRMYCGGLYMCIYNEKDITVGLSNQVAIKVASKQAMDGLFA